MGFVDSLTQTTAQFGKLLTTTYQSGYSFVRLIVKSEGCVNGRLAWHLQNYSWYSSDSNKAGVMLGIFICGYLPLKLWLQRSGATGVTKIWGRCQKVGVQPNTQPQHPIPPPLNIMHQYDFSQIPWVQLHPSYVKTKRPLLILMLYVSIKPLHQP